MRRLRLSTLLGTSAWVVVGLGAGCTVNNNLDGFACRSDDDCVAGYICEVADGEDIGECTNVPNVDPDECEDNDGDDFFAGDDCSPDLRIDCDDTDPQINPDAEELCDLDDDGEPLDNDCDGAVDESAEGEGVLERSCPRAAGLCVGSRVECSNGVFPVCEPGIGYPDEYEPVELTCDGIDNSCDGNIDENCCPDPPARPTDGCTCRPGQVYPCGSDTGACTRGVQVCTASGVDEEGGIIFQLSECLEAGIGGTCTTNDDCSDAENGYCVTETVSRNEDLNDECNATDTCTRSVCRYLPGTLACESDMGCESDESCVAACDVGVCADRVCQPRTVTPLPGGEVCNGIDDNCDGRIDDDQSRRSFCGPCPYNMVLIDYETLTGTRQQVCVDQYEATRADATMTDAGSSDLYSIAQPGVLPWTGIGSDDAMAACQATAYTDLFSDTFALPIAAKRLCFTYELEQACGGTNNTASENVYPYGDELVASSCWDGSTGVSEPQPTGTRDTCCRTIRTDPNQGEQATCDISGNVGEWVIGAGNLPFLAGGSFLDSDASALECEATIAGETVPQPYGNYVGFRCCATP